MCCIVLCVTEYLYGYAIKKGHTRCVRAVLDK